MSQSKKVQDTTNETNLARLKVDLFQSTGGSKEDKSSSLAIQQFAEIFVQVIQLSNSDMSAASNDAGSLVSPVLRKNNLWSDQDQQGYFCQKREAVNIHYRACNELTALRHLEIGIILPGYLFVWNYERYCQLERSTQAQASN